MIRQGDILFIPMRDETLNTQGAKVRDNGIIAEGEATGHHHRVAIADMPNAELLELGWQRDLYLRVTGDSISIVHEEHHTVTLPKGDYKVHQAREFDYLGQFSRAVRD